MSLYSLTGELMELQTMLEDVEAKEDVRTVIKDTLEGIEGEYDIKMEAYSKVVKNLEAQSKAIKDETDRLSNKKKTIDNNINEMKAAMMDSLKAVGKTKAGGDIFTVTIQKNGGKTPIVMDAEVIDLPFELVKIEQKPDMEAIRAYLDNGGTEYAHFGERGESLRIK